MLGSGLRLSGCAAFNAIDGAVALAAAVVETLRGVPLVGLMGAADLALARAETAGPFTAESAKSQTRPRCSRANAVA